MDRIRATGFKYNLKFDAETWRTAKPKIIADIKNAFRNGGHFQPFYEGDYLELYFPFDRGNIHNGFCQLIIDAGDKNMTVCEISNYEKTNRAMSLFNNLVAKWKTELNSPALTLEAQNIKGQ